VPVHSRLSPLQSRVLEVLAGLGWTLTGGGALAGYHLGHRTTRDLDLFWHGRTSLDHLPAEVVRRLTEAGLESAILETAPAFRRVRVSDGVEVVPLDLVSDPVPVVEPPIEMAAGILVDTRREILANKLTALLSRWAVRDLVDVRALVASGEDLDQGLRDAAAKDGGFSPPTLAWVLSTVPDEGLDDDLRRFKTALIDRLVPR
jgi:hypothetical protein